MSKDKVNMFNDILFKEFFKSEEARALVSRFLSAITGMKKELFLNATYITEELNTKQIEEKRKTTDVIVKIDDKNRIVVEMNQTKTADVSAKATKYAFSVVSIKTKRKESYNDSRVILINIDNYNAYETDYPILEFKIRDQFGNIENNIYTSYHLVIENVINSKYNVDKEIEKFSMLLIEDNIEKMKSTFKGDADYMAGIVKVEDMLKDIDEVGLLYDVEENHAEEKKGAYLAGAEDKEKESARNFYKNGVSKEIICASLNISLEKLEDYLKKLKD